MGQNYVLVLLVATAVIGSFASMTDTALGDSPYDPGNNPGGDSLFGSIFAGATSFLSALSFPISGVWILDNWIIKPIGVFLIYKGTALIRGGGG